MVTAGDLKAPAHIRVQALFNILNPCPIDPNRDIIFTLARRRAGVTADAPIVTNQEAIVHMRAQ